MVMRFTVHYHCSLYIINFSIAFTIKPSTQSSEREFGGVSIKRTCYIYFILFDVNILTFCQKNIVGSSKKETKYMS